MLLIFTGDSSVDLRLLVSLGRGYEGGRGRETLYQAEREAREGLGTKGEGRERESIPVWERKEEREGAR